MNYFRQLSSVKWLVDWAVWPTYCLIATYFRKIRPMKVTFIKSQLETYLYLTYRGNFHADCWPKIYTSMYPCSSFHHYLNQLLSGGYPYLADWALWTSYVYLDWSPIYLNLCDCVGRSLDYQQVQKSCYCKGYCLLAREDIRTLKRTWWEEFGQHLALICSKAWNGLFGNLHEDLWLFVLPTLKMTHHMCDLIQSHQRFC